MVYARKCQECGHIQESKPPSDYKHTTWQDVKCKKCGSRSLDYGHNEYIRKDGKIERVPYKED